MGRRERSFKKREFARAGPLRAMASSSAILDRCSLAPSGQWDRSRPILAATCYRRGHSRPIQSPREGSRQCRHGCCAQTPGWGPAVQCRRVGSCYIVRVCLCSWVDVELHAIKPGPPLVRCNAAYLAAAVDLVLAARLGPRVIEPIVFPHGRLSVILLDPRLHFYQ